jgi:hypothetical protein
MKFCTLSLLLLFSASLAAPTLAQAAGPAIDGTVRNGSAQNQALATQVSLYDIDGPTKMQVDSAQSAADGSFHFDGGRLDAQKHYVASVNYEGVSYTSDLLQLGTNANADITVYEATSDRNSISVDRLLIVPAAIDRHSGLITLVESYHIQNAGSQTFVGSSVGGRLETLRLPLFGGARNLNPLEGFSLDDASEATQGFALDTPLLPGASVISFSYDVPFRSSATTLQSTMDFDVGTVQLILPGNVSITSPNLTQHQTINLGGRSFDSLVASKLQSGDTLRLNVTGLPVASAPLIDLRRLPVQVLTLGVIIAAVACFVFVSRRRLPAQTA